MNDDAAYLSGLFSANRLQVDNVSVVFTACSPALHVAKKKKKVN